MATKFDAILSELKDIDQPLKAETMYGLSDMKPDDLKALQATWGAIPADRRATLIQRLSEVVETNFELDYSDVARLALTDLNDVVREVAIDLTWLDESADMATRLIAMASGDIAAEVRAEAVGALGRFILAGELGKFDPAVARRAENVAIRLYNDSTQSVNVRRRALESIANCGREGVTEMIEQAYQDRNLSMRVSALFAMGRSCDPRWEPIVQRELESDYPELRFEATRSAGELEMRQAVPLLEQIIRDADREVVEMAIWSLGEIGGHEAVHILDDEMERAEMAEDAALAEAIEEAMESASLADLAL